MSLDVTTTLFSSSISVSDYTGLSVWVVLPTKRSVGLALLLVCNFPSSPVSLALESLLFGAPMFVLYSISILTRSSTH